VSKALTDEQFRKVLPKNFHSKVDSKFLNKMNKLIQQPELRENYRDNMLSHTTVLRDSNWSLKQYADAVRYVSFKLLGSSNIESYTKTFPDRYQRMLQQNVQPKNIAGIVSAYNKGQLVNKIIEQTLIPTHIINADLYQQALNVQADLMLHAHSETVRMNAANSLLDNLKAPEVQEVELRIGLTEDKSIQDLRETTLALVAEQRRAIELGAKTVQEIAHSKLKVIEHVIEGEVID